MGITRVSAGKLSHVVKVTDSEYSLESPLTLNHRDSGEWGTTQSHQHDTFQRGDETSYSLSSSFAFYGKNNALLSDILHHTSEHTRTL